MAEVTMENPLAPEASRAPLPETQLAKILQDIKGIFVRQ